MQSRQHFRRAHSHKHNKPMCQQRKPSHRASQPNHPQNPPPTLKIQARLREGRAGACGPPLAAAAARPSCRPATAVLRWMVLPVAAVPAATDVVAVDWVGSLSVTLKATRMGTCDHQEDGDQPMKINLNPRKM